MEVKVHTSVWRSEYIHIYGDQSAHRKERGQGYDNGGKCPRGACDKAGNLIMEGACDKALKSPGGL